MQFYEFLNEFYQFGFSSNRVRLCTMRAFFEANEDIYFIRYILESILLDKFCQIQNES